MLGPVLGPAVGAIIAVHSVTAFAGVSVLCIVTGIVVAGIAIWPSLKRETRPQRVETEKGATTLSRAA
jgi:MFS family permease